MANINSIRRWNHIGPFLTVSSFTENNTNNNQTQLSDSKCQNLLNDGNWENWEDHGFERIGDNKPEAEFSSMGHPLESTSYMKKWHEQNYSGNWVSADNCKIHRFSKIDLEHCFSTNLHGLESNSSSEIVIVGDSRGRQLFLAFKQYFEMKKDRWKDPIIHSSLIHSTNTAKLKYFWSTSFRKWGLDKHTNQFLGCQIPHLFTPKNRFKKINQNTRYLIISDLIVHRWKYLKRWSENKIFDQTQLSISSRVKKIIKLISKEQLTKFKKLKILVLASFKGVPESKHNLLKYNKVIDAYNSEVERIVEQVANTNIKFVRVIDKIGTAPRDGETIGFPLVADGVHLSRHFMQPNASRLVPSLNAIVEVLLNFVCKGSLPANTESNCCQ